MKGIYARTLTLTDVNTGWVHLEAIPNNAMKHITAGLARAKEQIPFLIQAMDFDNGSEFINHDVARWLLDRDIYFTRSRPYQKNDQANVESKNNHVVGKYGFHYRYDTPEELKILRLLREVVCLRMNLFTPAKKPVGWSQDQSGRRKRVYDKPATPLDRLLAAGVLSCEQEQQLRELRDNTNPAELTRDILHYQDMLIDLAGQPTELLLIAQEQAREKRKARLEGGIKKHSA